MSSQKKSTGLISTEKVEKRISKVIADGEKQVAKAKKETEKVQKKLEKAEGKVEKEKKKRVMSEEQKQVLRERLVKARAARQANLAKKREEQVEE